MADQKMSLVVFDPIRATLVELEKKDKSLVFDYTTASGEKELRSWVHRLRGYKTEVTKVHKDTKADALAFGRKVDAVKNELIDGVEKLIAERMKPLDEIEAKKRAAAEAIIEAKRLEDERIEQERLDAIAKQEAEIAEKQAAIKAEENRLTRERENLEAEKRAEVDAKNREIEARKEAEAKAEREKQEALDKAEREKAEAIEAEKEKARQAEGDRLSREAVEKDQQRKLADTEAKRVADKEHRKEVEQGVVDAIVIAVMLSSDSIAQEIVDAIVNGEIPNLTINY